jgi:hypothetical protein
MAPKTAKAIRSSGGFDVSGDRVWRMPSWSFVTYRQIDIHQARDPRCITIVHHAVALHHIVAIREPTPGSHESRGLGTMVSIEDANEPAAHLGQRGIDILGF